MKANKRTTMSIKAVDEATLRQAQAAYDRAEVSEALQLVESALQNGSAEGTSATTTIEEALELKGELLAESGQLAQAISFYAKACSAHPTFAGLRLAQAQLLNEKEALYSYREGVTIYETKLDDADLSSGEASLIISRIIEALCGMVEIYLTECCFEPEAESECERLLEKALSLQADASHPLQLLASVRLSQNREEDAVQLLEKSLETWLTPLQSAQEEAEEKRKTRIKKKEAAKAEELILPDNFPPFEQRLACTRLCMEVGKFAEALDILYYLQMENDEVIDIWYLYGLCHHFTLEQQLAEEENEETEKSLRAHAADCFATAWKLYQRHGSADTQMVSHIKEMTTQYPTEQEEEEESEEPLDEDMT